MTKPNKDGWIRHRGGECPVAEGTMVDVLHRSGKIYENRKAGEGAANDWTHDNHPGDILAYRLHKPKTKEPALMTTEQIRTQFIENLAAIAELHKEQAALVQQLRELGFAFVDAN